MTDTFITDDAITLRLRQIRDEATHLKYTAGKLEREAGELIKLIDPHDQARPAATTHETERLPLST